MDKTEALQAVIADPNRPENEKQVAHAALERIAGIALADAEVEAAIIELVEFSGKSDRSAIDYHTIHRYCSTRKWDNVAKRVYERWIGMPIWEGEAR